MPASRSQFLSAYSGRNQGPELLQSVPFVAGAQTLLPKNVTLQRPLEALIFEWKGRVVVSVANMGAVAAEAPMTILDRIRIFGTWKGSALTPFDISGATAFLWPGLFRTLGSSCYINGVRQPTPSVPFAQTLANFGNTGTYDVQIFYVLPVWPIIDDAARGFAITPYLWQPGDWSDTLQIQLNFGDTTSFGTAGGATVALSAFGSGAGSPTVNVYTRYAILSDLRKVANFRTNVVLRNEQTVNAGISAVANAVRLQLLAKQKTTNVLLKSGQVLTGTSAAAHVFASLSDTQFDVTQIMLDNRPVRNNFSNMAAKEHHGRQFTSILPQGYLNFSFIDSQSPRTAFRADLPNVVGPGSNFELDSNIITPGANPLATIVQEQIFSDRDDPHWALGR